MARLVEGKFWITVLKFLEIFTVCILAECLGANVVVRYFTKRYKAFLMLETMGQKAY